MVNVCLELPAGWGGELRTYRRVCLLGAVPSVPGVFVINLGDGVRLKSRVTEILWHTFPPGDSATEVTPVVRLRRINPSAEPWGALEAAGWERKGDCE